MDYQKAEYEIQLFNFSAEQMKLENRLMVKTNVQQLTCDFVDALIKKANISNETADEIRKKTNAVKEQIMERFEGIFNEMDSLIENYFCIPEYVLLAEDSKHEKYAASDEEYYKAKVTQQEDMLKQNVYLLTALGKELERFETLQPVVNSEQWVSDKLDQSLQVKLNVDEFNVSLTKFQEIVARKNNC